MRLTSIALLCLAVTACGGGEVADGVDGCTAACIPNLKVTFSGLEADKVYEISAETSAESISCSVDTTDGLTMHCGTFTFYSDDIADAVIPFEGNPESVTVTVELDSEVLVSRSLTPEYHSYSICGQVCDVGELVVTI